MDGRFCTAVFCENLGLHVRKITSVDMDINGKFHIYGKPGKTLRQEDFYMQFSTSLKSRGRKEIGPLCLPCHDATCRLYKHGV